jgi:hypothetical protein
MKQRMMGVSFSLKSRDSKNRYINSQMKDGLYELDVDLMNYGKDIVMRKLLITYLSTQSMYENANTRFSRSRQINVLCLHNIKVLEFF